MKFKRTAQVLLLLIVVLSAVASLSFISIGHEEEQPEMEIYLLSNEIHTDIALPVKSHIFDWETFIDPANFKSRPTGWIEIGWGDRQFYFDMPTWDHFTWKLAADALFWPDPAVMHVSYLNDHPLGYASSQKIKISFKTYEKLVNALKNQFILKNGKPILLEGKGYSPSDNFYDAQGSYSIVRTCNVWTAQILGEVDLKRPIWSPTKHGLEYIWQEPKK